MQENQAHTETNKNRSSRIILAVALVAVLAVAAIAAWYYLSPPSQENAAYSSSTGSNIDLLLSARPAPVRGSPNATVTIVEFGDFQCPTCDAWYRTQGPPILQNLINTGKAKFEWRDFDFYGPDSVSASEAVYAAGDQGKFWQFYDLLYSNQQAPNSGWADPQHLAAFAQQLGLNVTEFNQSIQNGKYASAINANYNLGTQLGVTETPTFFVYGTSGNVVTIAGDQPYSVFESAVNSLMST
jgi:protein-disulfide isomerase